MDCDQNWAGSAVSTPQTALFQGCKGTCEGTFEGIGFAFDCIDEAANSQAFNISDAIHQNGSMFIVNFEMSWGNASKNYASIIMDGFAFTSDAASGSDCNGKIDDVLSAGLNLDNNLSLSWNGEKNQLSPYHVKKYLPIAETGEAGALKLGGVYLAFQNYLAATANATFNIQTQKWSLRQQGTFALQSQAGTSVGEPELGSCNFNFSQGSTWTVVNYINAMGFMLTVNNYPSMGTGEGTQQTQVRQQPLAIHYQTHKGFIAGAIISMILCTLLVLPTYYGFWELGRPVNLAPVEIANAFRAPVLEN
ncbi:hypothetical protein EJ08DRAFT_468488 [Tothia fuscella]|uniref:Uncharacterized protein n=1 Tax=Tothia fuscella TaxID=1048955 RepID=A0A9P4P096_9PEZI|nr:hypothetical protein EJ08DRAFT_468488 [Tothia fuscella]